MLPIEILYQKIKDDLPNKYQARIIKNYIVINTPFVNQMHDSIVLTIQFKDIATNCQ